MRVLRIHVHESEPYPLDLFDDFETALADAIEDEADNVVSEANADHLEENTDECRDLLRKQVIEDASRALREVGDSFTDPIGVVWSIEERP